MDTYILENFKKRYNFYPLNILDIGANNGFFSDVCKRVWNNVNLTLIEANPLHEPALKCTGYKYIISLLGSDSKPSINFYRSKLDLTSTGCSIYKEKSKYFNDDNTEVIELPMNRLDDLVFDTYELIKMDTQGSELDIIKGGLTVIGKCKFILMEVSLKEVNENAPLKEEAINYLKTINFSQCEILCNHYDGDILIQEDILFKNDNLVE